MTAQQCVDRAWCAMGGFPQEHEEYHAGDPVELAGSNGTGERGWWAWLTEDRPDGPLMVVVEGKGHASHEIPAEAVIALLTATSSPPARQTLVEAMTSAGVEIPS